VLQSIKTARTEFILPVCCSVLQRVAVRCIVLQCVAVCCRVMQGVAIDEKCQRLVRAICVLKCIALFGTVLHVLHCVAVYCSVLQLIKKSQHRVRVT